MNKPAITIVYYQTNGAPAAMHVEGADSKKLKQKMRGHDIAMIKHITISRETLSKHTFITLYREAEIHDFKTEWGLD